jgi:hypothetical protein
MFTSKPLGPLKLISLKTNVTFPVKRSIASLAVDPWYPEPGQIHSRSKIPLSGHKGKPIKKTKKSTNNTTSLPAFLFIFYSVIAFGFFYLLFFTLSSYNNFVKKNR